MRLRKNMKRAAAVALALSVALSAAARRHWQRIIISKTVILR